MSSGLPSGMPEEIRTRVAEKLQRSENWLATMARSDPAAMKRAAWMHALEASKSAIEILNSFCEGNGRKALKERFFGMRTGDSRTNYAWEARNAEEHHPNSPSAPVPGGVMFRPVNPLKGMTISVSQDSAGRVTSSGTGFWEQRTPATIELRTAHLRNGKAVPAPNGATAEGVAQALLDHAKAYFEKAQRT